MPRKSKKLAPIAIPQTRPVEPPCKEPDFFAMTPNFVQAVLEQNALTTTTGAKQTNTAAAGGLSSSEDKEFVASPAILTEDMHDHGDEDIDWKARAKFFERSLDTFMDMQTMFTGVPVDWKQAMLCYEAFPTLSERLHTGVSSLAVQTENLIVRCDALDLSVDVLKCSLEMNMARANANEARADSLAEALAKTEAHAKEGEARANSLAEALAQGEARYTELAAALAEAERSNEEIASSNAILRAKVWDQRRIMSENHSGNFSEVQQENASLLMKLDNARQALAKTGAYGGEERPQLIKALGKLRHEKAVLEEQLELVRKENSRLAVIVHDYAVKEKQQP